MDTTLQQLMLTDDVISDPKEVQAIFKTLADISPSLATDPSKMGPALKEGIAVWDLFRLIFFLMFLSWKDSSLKMSSTALM